MSLSNELISQFVKISKDETEVKNETTVKGTIKVVNNISYVQLDGSDLLTPITTTTDVVNNERVNVLIKDHTATVTGNISSPAARTATVQSLSNTITEVGNLVATKASISDLDAAKARINTLEADNVTINGKLTTAEADIDNLKADNVTINGKLTAAEADIDNLEVNKIDATVANATFATIANLSATNGRVYNLETTYTTVNGKLTAAEADINNLETNKLDASTAEITYANIDFSNIGNAALQYLYSTKGIIDDLVIDEGRVTGTLVGVTIIGDLIDAGTVKADKLVVLGEDGLYYKLNTDGKSITTKQTDYNSLHGSIITANTITAEKIDVEDLVAFDATIGGFHITNNSIYSGVKSSADNYTRGVYLDSNGQLSVGDSNNFLKYYNDNGTYKLAISANSLKFSTTNKTVQETISDSINDVTIGGRNLLRGTDFNKSDNVPGFNATGTYEKTADGIKYTGNGSGNAGFLIPLAYNGCLNEDDVYTLSFMYRSSVDDIGNIYVMQDTTPNIPLINSSTVTINGSSDIVISETDWKRFEWTFRRPSINVRTCVNLLIPYFNTGWFEIKSGTLMLEKGSKASDWSPAPEDTDNSIETTKTSLTDAINESVNGLINESDLTDALTDYSKTTDVDKTIDTKLSDYVTTDTLEQANFLVENDVIEMGFLKSGDIHDYIRFSSEGIELGSVNNPLTLKINEEKIEFINNGTTVSYWDGNKFHTGNIEVDVTERARFGNFAFIPRSDGSLSFLKVDSEVSS